jgi:hypothetical protein
MQAETMAKPHSLIASDRIEGTLVYHPGGIRIGTIERVMIDKVSGKVAYAVLNFGGFLGFGEKHFPVPWASLKYNIQREAYEAAITEEQLRGAPSHGAGEDFDWGNRTDETLIHSIYSTGHYWD